MHRSDRIYLSKFALDQDLEYLDLENFNLDCEFDSDEFYEEILFDIEKEFVNRIIKEATVK